MNDIGQRQKFVLGISQKAGKLASGDFAVKAALKNNTVKLLVIAADAAANTKKELQHLAQVAKVATVELLTAEEIGAAIGKERRVSVAFLDDNFAKMLKSTL